MQVLVRYGAPISISATSPSFLKGDYRATAYFLDLSINSPNWNTLYAARVARNITPLWAGTVMVRHIYSNIFRSVFPKAHILLHRPVNNFTTKSNLPASLQFKSSPIKYYSLLHYTSTTHTSLPTSIPALPSLLYLFSHHNISCSTQESFSFPPFRIAAGAQRVVKSVIGYSWGIFDWDI